MSAPLHRRCRPRQLFIELLENRIAPATTLVLTSGAGPFTLELDAADSHLHLTNGTGAEIFDQGGAIGNDLTITGGAASDLFLIHGTPARNLSFTGALVVDVAGPITVDAGISTVTGLDLTAGDTITLAGANADLQASAGPVALTTFKNIVATTGSSLSVVNGNLNLFANTAGTAVGDFIGIELDGATLTTSGTGHISLLGKGSIGGITAGLSGVALHNATVIQSTRSGPGAGTITVTGFGAQGLAGNPDTQGNSGVEIGTFGAQLQPLIASVSGAILINGTGGTGAKIGQGGIMVHEGGQIVSSGTGNNAASITLLGTGGNNAAGYNYGVVLSHIEAGASGTAITSVDGNIALTGVAGNGGGINQGVVVYTGSKVAATGSGSINITGSGGTGGQDNTGVLIGEANPNGQSSQVTAVDGSIVITGTSGLNAAGKTEAGAIGLNSGSFVKTTGLGSITLIGDNMNIGVPVDAGTHAVTIKPKSGIASVALGGSQSDDPAKPVLGLSSNDFKFITAGTLRIGDAATAGITVSNGFNLTTNLELSAVDLAIKDFLKMAKDRTLTLSATNNIDLSTDDSEIFTSGIGTLSLTAGNSLFVRDGARVESEAALSLSARNVTFTKRSAVSFGAGVLNLGSVAEVGLNGGTLAGPLDGNSLQINAHNPPTLTGLVDAGAVSINAGNIFLGSRTALQKATVTVSINQALQFAPKIRSFILGGLTGPGDVALADNADVPIDLRVGANNDDTAFLGALGGNGSLTKIGTSTLTLSQTNAFPGTINIAAGEVQLATANAAQTATVSIGAAGRLLFSGGIGVFNLGALAGAGALDLQDVQQAAVDLHAGTSNADSIYTGTLGKVGKLTKVGTGALTLSGRNDLTAGVRIEMGTLKVASDAALGAPGVGLTMTGGTLHALNSFATLRPIVLESGTATFEANPGRTLTLAGVISGSGNLAIGPTGTVQVTNLGNSNSGTVEAAAGATTVVNGVTVTTPGGIHDIIITPGTTPNTLANIDLTTTNTPVSLTVKSPATGTVTVEKIISNDTTPIKSLTLGAGVILGNGAADAIPDVMIKGKVTTVQIADVRANTIIQLGKGLAYLDTYKNNPNVTLRDVLGPGVVLDVAGDGITSGQSGGIGGGGLGKIVVNSWSAPGVITTTQGIKSLIVKTGDAYVSLLVDPSHLGTATVANVGLVSIPNGSWAGTGMQVEGTVAQFLTKGLVNGSNISAGAFGTIKIKGDFAGDIEAKADPNVYVVVRGKHKVIATGAIGSVTISSGNFTGLINANGKVGNITLTGSAQFMGTVRGGSLGNISADSFTGTPGIDGVRHTITAIGSIGRITATAGGLTNYVIAAGADLGSDAKFGGVADSFSSYVTNPVTHVNTIVSIGAVTIKGDVVGTTIAAGIDPGSGGVYGDGNDIVVPRATGMTTKTKIGALKFALNNVNELTVSDSAGYTVSNAFEAQTMTSVQLGLGKIPGSLLKKFDTDHFIDSGSSSIIVRVLP